MIPPGSWLGLLGGGQLGRMFAQAAQRLGYRVLVVDPDPSSPTGAIAEHHLQADYADPSALDELTQTCAAVTTEFENVPAAALERLAARIPSRPSGSAVRIAQDRMLEKAFLAGNGFAVAPFHPLASPADCESAPAALFPGVVKTSRLGYDGKGQAVVRNHAELGDAFRALRAQPCVLEQKIVLAREISVLVARSRSGSVVVWPIAENAHRNGILDVTIVPARITGEMAEEARATGIRIAERLDYVGVLCVEMFVTTDGRLLVNEMAPRPHNSGHWTIDGAVTSQFEQQCRALVDAPLGAVAAHSDAVMVNLLGDIWFASPAATTSREPDWRTILEDPTAKLHLYGKHEPRRGRKMGHVTFVGGTLDARLASVSRLKQALGIPER
jgi:5-(carboxyamino)imidazole ribonucleotide synthase